MKRWIVDTVSVAAIATLFWIGASSVAHADFLPGCNGNVTGCSFKCCTRPGGSQDCWCDTCCIAGGG